MSSRKRQKTQHTARDSSEVSALFVSPGPEYHPRASGQCNAQLQQSPQRLKKVLGNPHPSGTSSAGARPHHADLTRQCVSERNKENVSKENVVGVTDRNHIVGSAGTGEQTPSNRDFAPGTQYIMPGIGDFAPSGEYPVSYMNPVGDVDVTGRAFSATHQDQRERR